MKSVKRLPKKTSKISPRPREKASAAESKPQKTQNSSSKPSQPSPQLSGHFEFDIFHSDSRDSMEVSVIKHEDQTCIEFSATQSSLDQKIKQSVTVKFPQDQIFNLFMALFHNHIKQKSKEKE